MKHIERGDEKSDYKSRTLYEQLADDVAGLIEGGTYRPGERIPSVRQISSQKKVSVTTVLQAYGLLEDHGLIEARPQSGYYVRHQLPAICDEPDMSAPATDPTKVSMRELTMMVMTDSYNPRLVPLGAATPNTDLLPTQKLNRILAAIARRKGSQSIKYDIPPASNALWIQIARQMVKAGCTLTPGDIVTASGCIEAVNLCLRSVCKAGDTVAIESPTYFGILQSMCAMDLNALEIPTHPRDGISLDALGFATEQTPIKACLVISNFNNPLGSCIPDEKKRQLVGLLAEREIPLIEVDVSGELYFSEPRPRVCKAYDSKGLVMLCSSFSKTLCPGYRVGWIAPGRFKSTIEWLKFTSSIATGFLPQQAIAEYLESGGYQHHMRQVRRAYAHNVSRMTDAVVRHFPGETRITRPAGGFVIWIELPKSVDSLVLYKLALQAGISLSPGYLFSPSKRFRNFIRLNASRWTDEIERAIPRLGDLIDGLAG
ncbi:MAG: PLP-dependent aminotransferase family protein [Desulfobacteraceae bacterium]|nr:PLP-dependent aminotransferase family protein [Desulfobacteraceae bacterium]